MLQAIWDGISGIWEAIISVIEFIIDFIRDLIDVIVLVGETVARVPSYLGFLPIEVVVVLITIFGVVVLYKVLGREG